MVNHYSLCYNNYRWRSPASTGQNQCLSYGFAIRQSSRAIHLGRCVHRLNQTSSSLLGVRLCCHTTLMTRVMAVAFHDGYSQNIRTHSCDHSSKFSNYDVHHLARKVSHGFVPASAYDGVIPHNRWFTLRRGHYYG